MTATRRSFLAQNALLSAAGRAALAAPFAAAAANSATAAAPIADTVYGKLRGRTEAGIHVFRGVRYGASTEGKNRFQAPRKPAPWTGVKDAINWGNVAPQAFNNGNWDYTNSVQWAIKPGGLGEDCLVLNVYTPGLKDGGKRAVMLSIHGGGYTSGTGHNPVFDGKSLAKMGNVVVVTINHRLGALGFLNLSEMAPEFAQSGVAGMMDIVAALEWVRDNIANFGGDPGRVMIFGQSGGGGKVCHLMSMPSAKGLFHRAAIQSGATMRSGSKETAARSAERLMQQLALPKARFHELQQMPWEFIIGAAAAAGGQMGPVLDGVAIPRDPFQPDAPAISADVPMMGGSNLHDSGSGRTDFSLTEQAAQEELKTLGANAASIWSAYRAADPKATPAQLVARISSDRGLRANTRTVLERKAALGKAPAFLYLLRWGAPFMGGRYGSVHGTDVPLIFHNPELWPLTAGSKESGAVADAMAGAFIAFAKTGDPSTKALPWPKYDPATKPTMLFDVQSAAKNDPDRELLALLPAPAPR